MKKFFALLMVASLMGTAAFAQRRGSGGNWYNSYAPGIDEKVLINGGIGFGPTSGYNASIIPLSVSADFKLPVARPITVGGVITYTQWKYELPVPAAFNLDPVIKWDNLGFGVRGMYHFSFARNLDTYAGITVGYVIQTIDFGDMDPDGTYAKAYGASSFFHYGLNVGARYFFTQNVGAYLEVGLGNLQNAGLGLAVKLGNAGSSRRR